jgi:CRISPR-associated protein Cas2
MWAATRTMKGISDYVVIYDISSDTERRKVDAIVKDYGFRIQKSVFECKLNARLRKELVGRITQLNPQTGFVKIYRLEYSYENPAIGSGAQATIDEGHAFIV